MVSHECEEHLLQSLCSAKYESVENGHNKKVCAVFFKFVTSLTWNVLNFKCEKNNLFHYAHYVSPFNYKPNRNQ